MNDLISRQMVLRCIKESRDNIDWGQSEDGDAFLNYTGALYRTIASEEQLPSAEPQIIRCKDCKHYQFADNRAFGMPVKMCEWFGFEDVDDDDYCSRAERRKEE